MQARDLVHKMKPTGWQYEQACFVCKAFKPYHSSVFLAGLLLYLGSMDCYKHIQAEK
jgi:hypothetical protein